MVRYSWAYFLNRQELTDLYKAAGGTIGTFDTDNVYDLLHARRAIFQYLMPGRVQIWYASLDGDDGMVFFVGKPVLDIRKAVKRDLAKRCWDMFERCPNPCEVVANSGGLKWTLSRTGTPHQLDLIEFMQSDRKGDRYPLIEADFAQSSDDD
ncbi:hypothetical protein FRC11_005898 [Ceratobasidium sp. 423]|nr:hypothetical protein FRC11_005898 [Ceratobasidium sp. 423]